MRLGGTCVAAIPTAGATSTGTCPSAAARLDLFFLCSPSADNVEDILTLDGLANVE